MKIGVKFMGRQANKGKKKVRIDELNNEDEILSFLYEEFGGKIGERVFADDENPSFDDDLIDASIISEDCDDKEVLDDESSKVYWKKDTEDAIIEFLYLNEFFYDARIDEEYDDANKKNRIVNRSYCMEMERRKAEVMLINDRESRREKIFRERIETPLKKLVENILYNYKLMLPDTDIKTQQRDCLTFLYTKFPNFNPWLQTKSFSYFGTVAKHYFLGNRKDYAKATKTVYNYDSEQDETDNIKLDHIKQPEHNDLSEGLFGFVTKYIEEEIKKGGLSKNDQRVGNAIVQIFKNYEILGVDSKSQIHQLIKENTRMETKDVAYSLQRFKGLYKILKQNFIQNKNK